MAGTPNYTSKPNFGSATLTTADTSRTAPAVTGTVFTPDATNNLGGMCERITVMPLATTVASVVRLFMHDGASYALFAEVGIPAATISGGTPVVPTVLSAVDYPQWFPKMVPPGSTIRATVNDVQTGIKIIGEGGSF